MKGAAPAAGDLGAPRVGPWVHLVWVVGAFLSAVCGIGGGLFAVPLLHYLAKLELRRAVATSLCLVFVLSVVATGVELVHARSGLVPWIVAILVGGGWVGARLGFGVAQRVRPTWLKAIFALVLVSAGLRVLVLEASVSPEGAGAGGFDAANAAVVLAIGFGGGFVAPLLGVGGGLIVIPALFLSIPGLDYLEARACSLAMTVVVACRSARLYWKAGLVERRLAARLAALTVLGAVTGVLAVHGAGWADVARTIMGLILIVVSLRFAADVLRARAAA